jgi:thiamine-monophosphate kinase
MSDSARTEVGEIGEFGLIDRLSINLKNNDKSVIKGIGDDAAVIEKDQDYYTLISTDMLIEGVHFDLSYMPLQHLGYKAIAVNVSDIAAMNGIPKQVTVSIGVSNRFSVEALELIYEGISAAASQYNIDVVGGDTTASRSGLVISVSILGEVKKENVVYRSTAQDKDILCVTGDLGGAFIGLQVLEREKQEFLTNPEMQPQLDNYEFVVGRQLRPRARMDIIHEMAGLGIKPTAMIDVSDGLVSDVFHLCKQSGLGVSIYEDKLPIYEKTYQTAAEFKIDPNTCALNGGEDYELLFTISQEDYAKIENHEDIQVIGYMHPKEKGKVMVTRNQNVLELTAQGWVHF